MALKAPFRISGTREPSIGSGSLAMPNEGRPGAGTSEVTFADVLHLDGRVIEKQVLKPDREVAAEDRRGAEEVVG
jgi:hypothetical protein